MDERIVLEMSPAQAALVLHAINGDILERQAALFHPKQQAAIDMLDDVSEQLTNLLPTN